MPRRLFACLAACVFVLSACGVFVPPGDSEGACGLDGCSGPCASRPSCQPAIRLSRCGSADSHDRVHGLVLALPVPADYVALYEASSPSGDDVAVVASEGTLCARATDRSACKRSFEALEQQRRGWPGTSRAAGREGTAVRRWLAYSHGDAVGSAVTVDELRTLVLPFENLGEAALVLGETLDHDAGCVLRDDGGGQTAVAGGDGFVFHTRRVKSSVASCTTYDEHIDFVDRNGIASTRATESLRGGMCP